MELIASYEGFSPTVYRDAVGVETIGFGTTDHSIINTYRDRSCTRDEAQGWLLAEADNRCKPGLDALQLPLSQAQFDALISFSYNLGPGVIADANSAIGRALREKRFGDVPAALALYNHAGGKVLAGLTRRRAQEGVLFATADYGFPCTPADVPAPVSTRHRVLDIARSQLGVEENPPHSNHVPYWDWYGSPGQGNPWCACFVSWVFDQAGKTLHITTPKGFVYVPSGVAWFQSHGQLRDLPQAGFIALYPAHTGIVETVLPDGSFTAIEGNEGDAVRRVHRRVSEAVGFGDPLFTDDQGDTDEMLSPQDRVDIQNITDKAVIESGRKLLRDEGVAGIKNDLAALTAEFEAYVKAHP